MTSLFNAPPQLQYFVPDNAQSLIVIVHGMAEYCGRYAKVIEFFNARGLGCVTFDLSGHGRAPRSESERGDVKSFSEFISETTAAIEGAHAKYPRLRLFVWGHSMGSIIATLTAARLASQGPGKIRGVITSSAPIAAFDSISILSRGLAQLLALIVPRRRMSRPFKPERLSRNLQVGTAYASDPLVSKAITIRLLYGLAEASKHCLKVAPKVVLPWLALHGGEDVIAPPIGSQRLIDALGGADKQLRLWPGARHEVHNEIEPTRTEFLECIVEWVKERT